MPSVDERAATYREAMVQQIADAGLQDERVLSAMRKVPRHRFVERFHAFLPRVPITPVLRTELREWTIGEDADDATLEVAHALDGALLTNGEGRLGKATSSVSAPRLVASMLAELELEPGMRVLEIGAGSGYNAALLSELVGADGQVTTVDIDSAIVADAQARLQRLAYNNVSVIVGDGHHGVAEQAPFDRIVATVGCTELSPAWFAQLAPGGFMLIPLLHGGWHPRIRASFEEGRLHGRFIGASSFLPIRGDQHHDGPWPSRRSLESPDAVLHIHETPPRLTEALRPPRDRATIGGPDAFALPLYLALRDRRAVIGIALAGSDKSIAMFDHITGTLQVTGDSGDALAKDLIRLADDWIDIGMPSLDRYHIEFVPVIGERSASMTPGGITGPWVIRRVHHDEVIVFT
jgi:protein-L-isoaspartate(D-aspartate) O-methyltransferase